MGTPTEDNTEGDRVTLNLSWEEAQRLLTDLDHLHALSGQPPEDDPRRSIYGKLKEGVGAAMYRAEQEGENDG